ncbi:MAG TPA: NADPH:quinone oxidoreductase family protein, partial [Burkholderiales bacterium]|nr:NADPH:quinone oxidoreductase family protein [Burkholderiales bacterium]
MKAVLCKQFGPPETLVIEELPSPRPGPGEVVVSVKAASVNFPDVLVIQNKYQVKATPPFTPGSEFAGVVKEVGAGVTQVRPGDRVLGAGSSGGFAEECLVPAGARLVPIPASMDFPTAASFLLTYGTSHHALCNRADAKAGESLLVLGAAGGVGLAAVEIGKILGLRVIAAASSKEKLAVCREHGADETIDYSSEDLRERIKALTGGKGVDLIYDPVGGAYTETALRSSAWRARLLVVGFAAGEIPKIPLNLPLLMERSVVGVYWGEWSKRAPQEFAAAVKQLG